MAEMQRIPLGGDDKELNSKKSRETVVNLLAEATADGSWRTVKDSPGLTVVADETATGATRSNLFENAGFIYAVIGDALFRFDEFFVSTNLGVVGGSGRARIFANAVPGDSQIMVLNGAGDGFVFDNANGLLPVTDPDFFPTIAGDVLAERGWFTRQGTNEVFGSNIGNLLAYEPLTFLSAELNPDQAVTLIAKKSALWVLGVESTEYFQTIFDVTVPLRPVIGASKERGIAAVHSLAEAGERFCWFADDSTVRMIQGQQMVKISDTDFELRVRGDGTANFPGFSVIDDAIGFFHDGPVHKIYYLTFPTEGYTWAYDFTTGLTHRRESGDLGFWRVGSSVLFNNKLYGGDLLNGKIYELDQENKTEDGEIMKRVLVTPTVSFPVDWTLPYAELEMEVGQVTDPNAEPVMLVEYSKDGGYNYTSHQPVELGNFGELRKRVALRQFGRIVRHQDFILRFTVTDDVRVQFYSLWGVMNLDGA
jgi:hypothetical protein